MSILTKVKKYLRIKSITINYLVVVTGQKCTLRCKHCANFSPYFSREFDFYDMKNIIADLTVLTDQVREISLLQIQGGDFFLHKDAELLLSYIEGNDVITQCHVAHNCIVKPKANLISILKNPKFVVRFSSYGAVNEIKEQELCAYLRLHGVHFFFHSFANENGSWSYLGGVEQSKADKEKTRENYRRCAFRYCLTLENGIISRCSRATIAHHIQHFTPAPEDFINIRSCSFSINNLHRFIKNASMDRGIVEACYYCNGSVGGG